MANTRRLQIEILGDAKGLKGAFSDAEKSAGKFAGALGSVAKGAALGFAGMAAGAVALAPAILEQGAALEALANKSATVFEGSLADVQKWAAANSKAMGLTTSAATGLAAGMGDLLKPMGFSAEAAAEMSTQTLDLAGALSAWSGGQRSAAEVAEILTAAYLGETDSLKGLGIAISAAEVESALAAKGQQDLTGAALEQARALVIQELILAKSTDAQKAWADGSMDAMKAQNEARASVDQLKESVVTALYPALQALVPYVQQAAEWLGERLPVAMAAVKSWVDANWPAIRDAITSAIEVVRSGIAGFVTFVGEVWSKWGDEILSVVNTVWPIIRDTVTNAIEFVRGVIKTVTSIITGDWSAAWNGIKQAFGAIWDQIKTIISGAWDAIKLAASLGFEALKSLVSAGLDAVVGFVKGLPGRVSAAMSGAFDGIKTAFKAAINWIIDKWNGLEFSIPGVSVPGIGTVGGATIGTPNLPRLHTGGVVGGRTFGGLAPDEVAAILRQGETVLKPDQLSALTAGTDAGVTLMMTVNVAGSVISDDDLATVVIDQLQRRVARGEVIGI